MSKAITIQKSGVDTPVNAASKLNTAQVGGGAVSWVPEDEVQLVEKTITANGTYSAQSDGVYGWSVVTVAVGEITGTTAGVGWSLDVIDGNPAIKVTGGGT